MLRFGRPGHVWIAKCFSCGRKSLLPAERQQPRSYRIERILGATIMSRGFTPRYVIELTPSGPLAAPYTPRGSTSTGRQPPSMRRPTGNARPKTTYLYRCPICSKRFERSSMDPTLRTHKNSPGYPCAGRPWHL